jgi:hypothetical protein
MNQNWMTPGSGKQLPLPKTPADIFALETSKPILSRPVSAYVKQSARVFKPPKSSALYDITEQIQDLREKEVSLEKAKAGLWLAAEGQRHQTAILEMEKQHQHIVGMLKQH